MGHLVHVADDEGEGGGANELVPLGQPLPRRPPQLPSAGHFPLQLLHSPRSLILPDRPRNRALLHGARDPSRAPAVAGGHPHGQRPPAAPVREGRAWREHAEGPVAAAAAAGKEEEVALVLQRRGRHVASSELRATGVVSRVRIPASGHEERVCARNWLSFGLFPEFARRRGEHDAESVWLAWHVGHSAV